MFIRSENEIISLMPTARWNRPEQLKGYLEEEERVALEPLLGTPLYQHLCEEYERLTDTYVDITASTIKPTRKAKHNPGVPYADVTERRSRVNSGTLCDDAPEEEDVDEVPDEDMQTIRLIRICQQIEFYKMLSHKAGMLTVSFNEGGGMNVVSADGYDGADEKAKDRVVKDAYMSAGRAIDSLLLFLEADAKGERMFTDLWQEADAFYLHKDLLFQTARVLNEYLDIKGERMAYVQLVRDIRFCQNTYLKPRIGAKLLKTVVEWANQQTLPQPLPVKEGSGDTAGEASTTPGEEASTPLADREGQGESLDELLPLLRTALAFYVEARRVSLEPVKDKLARRDSMTDAQQAMAMACQYIEDNIDALGDAAVGTPIYDAIRARKEQEVRDAQDAEAAHRRMCRERTIQNRKKLFTAFPATHIRPEHK